MKITKEGKGQEVILKVLVEEGDYRAAVDKALKDYRKKADIPGFRAGMVPVGVIKKMYGKGVLAEEAYRLASQGAFDYIDKEKIEIIGDVLPSEKQGELDFDKEGAAFEFIFEIGLAPEVKIELTEKDKLTKYTIKPDKEMLSTYRSGFLRRFGTAEGVEPELNDDFFKMAFPDGSVKTEAEFDKFIDDQIVRDLSRETDAVFNIQLRKMLVEKAGLKMPEEFLKRWLFGINEGKFPMEQIEAEFPQFLEMMRWNLVQKHYAKELDIKVTPEDALAEAKNYAAMQFAQYGMPNVGDEMLENFAGQIMTNKDEARKVYDVVFERKILDAIVPMIKVTGKTVTAAEFNKVAEKL